jgi:hypothetical protein
MGPGLEAYPDDDLRAVDHAQCPPVRRHRDRRPPVVTCIPFRREGSLTPGNSLTQGDLVELVTVRDRDTAARIEQTWVAGRKSVYRAEPLAASRARIASAPRLAPGSGPARLAGRDARVRNLAGSARGPRPGAGAFRAARRPVTRGRGCRPPPRPVPG